jgi:plasmid stabilization system protein ParE
MALQRKWTQEAKDNIISILDYLLEHWTERDAKNFLIKLERIIALIEKRPLLYPRSRKNIHRAVVSKQITLYYSIKGQHLYLLQLFSNKQNPRKRKG